MRPFCPNQCWVSERGDRGLLNLLPRCYLVKQCCSSESRQLRNENSTARTVGVGFVCPMKWLLGCCREAVIVNFDHHKSFTSSTFEQLQSSGSGRAGYFQVCAGDGDRVRAFAERVMQKNGEDLSERWKRPARKAKSVDLTMR